MKTCRLIIAAMAVAAAVGFAACGSSEKQADATEAEATEATDAVVDQAAEPGEFTAETIRPDSKVARVTVLDFNAVWCGPCKHFAPAFEEASKQFEGQADFIEIDIDKCPETANAFGVTSIPTSVIITPAGKVMSYSGTDELLPAEKFFGYITEALN